MVVGLVLVKVGQWVWAHSWVLVVLGLVALLVLAGWIYRQVDQVRSEQLRVEGLTYSLGQLDAMHHSAFEIALRDLLARDGSRDVLRCGGRGDLGADVKGHDPLGRLWVIQCKHRRKGLDGSAVGTPELQTLNGTGRPVHGGDVVVMVTNGRISGPARDFARGQALTSLCGPASSRICQRTSRVPVRCVWPSTVGPTRSTRSSSSGSPRASRSCRSLMMRGSG